MLLSAVAVKELRLLSEGEARGIKEKMGALAEDPCKPRPKADIKKLAGTKPEFYRLRVGEYRIIYCVQENKVKVTEIMRRSRGYGWLE